MPSGGKRAGAGRPKGSRCADPRDIHVGVRLTVAEAERLDGMLRPGEKRSPALRRLSGIEREDPSTIQDEVILAAIDYTAGRDPKGTKLRAVVGELLDCRGAL